MSRETLVSYKTRDNQSVNLSLESHDKLYNGFKRLVLTHDNQRVSAPILAENSSAAVYSLVEALSEVAEERPDPDEFARHLDHLVGFFEVPVQAQNPVHIKVQQIF